MAAPWLSRLSATPHLHLAVEVAVAFGICAVVAETARARDLNDINFSLRLPAALSRFSPYSDVAGAGGASAGSRYQSSINPAATDWGNGLDDPYIVSPQYSAILFDRGPFVNVGAEALTVKTSTLGSFQPAAAQIRSIESNAGPFTMLNADYGQIQWGYKATDTLAIGLNFNYTSFDTRSGAAGLTFESVHSDTYDGRAGVLAVLAPHLMVGFTADFSRSPTATSLSNSDCGCTLQLNDSATQVLARPGLSYEYAELSSIYVDYQYGSYRNSTGTLSTNRIFSGIENRFLPWCFGRAGMVYDFRGIVSPTVGIGLYPTDHVSIDIAFQSNMFPELRPEFGHSSLFGISLAVSF